MTADERDPNTTWRREGESEGDYIERLLASERANRMKVAAQKEQIGKLLDEQRAQRGVIAVLNDRRITPNAKREAEIALLRNALEFYADPEHYIRDPRIPDDPPIAVLLDGGKRARKFLADGPRSAEFVAQKLSAERRVNAQAKVITLLRGTSR